MLSFLIDDPRNGARFWVRTRAEYNQTKDECRCQTSPGNKQREGIDLNGEQQSTVQTLGNIGEW